jgi:hypothetical protein
MVAESKMAAKTLLSNLKILAKKIANFFTIFFLSYFDPIFVFALIDNVASMKTQNGVHIQDGCQNVFTLKLRNFLLNFFCIK